MGGSSSGAPMKRSVPQSHENLKNHHNSTRDRLHFEVHKGGTNNCFQCGKAGHYTRDYPTGTIEGQKPLAIGYQPKQPA
jgi:hypothetical protein